MTLRTDFALRAEQRLALAPRMLQSIEILQLATAELAQRIATEVESNETLEIVAEPDPGSAGSGAAGGAGARDADAAAAFAAAARSDGERRPRRAVGAEDPKLAMLHAVPARDGDLRSHVAEQLGLEAIDDELCAKVLAITELLDEHGYLDLDDVELAARVGSPRLGEALVVLRGLEPPGLGARGPLEAMLAQVSIDDPDRAAIERVLDHHLEALAQRREGSVADDLGMEVDELHLLLERIARLEPRPAERWRDGGVPAVHPDVVVVRREDGGYDVVVDDVALPVLGVQSDYAEMADDRRVEASVRRYLRRKLRAAKDLIQAVRHRRETLARVAAEVFAEQEPFLRRGRAAIRPLRMSDVAEHLGLHTSTVSRAVAGKWVETDHGICRLRDFFDGARGAAAHPGGGAGQAVGRSAVQERVRALVAAEDPCQPLSDDELVRRLAESGVRVARRTVAKYRTDLGIPSSWRRRAPDGGAGRA